jgi:hypothetical protein
MPYFSDFSENELADKVRGVEPTYPSNWYLSFGTAADDASVTEIVHVSLPRLPYARSLANWAGTQGAGTTLASSGSSHVTSNNVDLTWATPSADLGPATHLLIWDALTGGNVRARLPIGSMPIVNGVAPVLPAGTVSFRMGNSGVSDYLSNKLIDEWFRGQAWSWPASIYGALYTLAPADSGGGTEVGAGDYSRAQLESTFDSISGTHGPGTTDASSGTSGRISNNVDITYPAPASDWGDIVAEGWKDAALSGNLLLWGDLPAQSILTGSPAPTHAPDSFAITLS